MGFNGHCLPTRLGWHIVQGAEIGNWVAQRLGSGYFAERSSSIGLQKNAKTIAGVIYENWNKRTVFCHIVIEGRLTKAYLKAIFDYPFNKLNVEKIIVPIVKSNEKSIKLVQNMGFVEEARIKDGAPNGDIIFMTLAKNDCRFLGARYG
jgi:L-amino acid N-acyltransferase YncA